MSKPTREEINRENAEGKSKKSKGHDPFYPPEWAKQDAMDEEKPEWSQDDLSDDC